PKSGRSSSRTKSVNSWRRAAGSRARVRARTYCPTPDRPRWMTEVDRPIFIAASAQGRLGQPPLRLGEAQDVADVGLGSGEADVGVELSGQSGHPEHKPRPGAVHEAEPAQVDRHGAGLAPGDEMEGGDEPGALGVGGGDLALPDQGAGQ